MGQKGEWSNARERHDRQKEWPHGVVIGQKRRLQQKKTHTHTKLSVRAIHYPITKHATVQY